MVGEIEQVANVVEGVVELGRRERPMPPVGARLAAGQGCLESTCETRLTSDSG